ncbi:MAG: hypothetical protein EOP52_12430 [Sphingobacteriales bacterium]|nr:MAG: hypothetical protein EOP52_12430 [Sphingobacteriales bacterium]
MKTQSYTTRTRTLTEKFVEVVSLIASCYTNGQLDNIEAMVLPWFDRVRFLRHSLIEQIQIRRVWVIANPEKAQELEGITTSVDTNLNREAA